MRKRRAHQKTICLVMKRIKIEEQKKKINNITITTRFSGRFWGIMDIVGRGDRVQDYNS